MRLPNGFGNVSKLIITRIRNPFPPQFLSVKYILFGQRSIIQKYQRAINWGILLRISTANLCMICLFQIFVWFICSISSTPLPKIILYFGESKFCTRSFINMPCKMTFAKKITPNLLTCRNTGTVIPIPSKENRFLRKKFSHCGKFLLTTNLQRLR